MNYIGISPRCPPNPPVGPLPLPARHTDPAPRRGAAVSASDEQRREIAALGAVSLRISASLDLETVLNEVVDSAGR